MFSYIDSSLEKIRAACLQCLSRREHSQHELLTKLALKGFNHADIQHILDELVQQGWQSDERFAQNYSKYRLANGFGALKIQYELKQRGIKNFDLNELVENEFGSWQELLLQAYQQKYPDTVNLATKEWLKRSLFLQQRGFSGTLIQKLFRQLKRNVAQSNDNSLKKL